MDRTPIRGLVSIFSENSKEGRWELPRHMRVLAIFGSTAKAFNVLRFCAPDRRRVGQVAPPMRECVAGPTPTPRAHRPETSRPN